MGGFERQTFLDRGRASGYFTLFPVQRLEFHDTELEIVRRGRAERIPYASLTADVLVTHRWKGVTAYSGSYKKQTLVTLASPHRRYRFDLSGQHFADFKPQEEILALVRSRIATTESSESLAKVKKRHNRDFMVFIVLGVLLVLWLARRH